MSSPRGNGQNGGHFYSNITQPVKVDLQFTVNSTDSGGAGITSLKSNGYVQSVFMNTSATPATGSPNPAAGYVMIQMKNNYNKYLGGFVQFKAPVTGSDLTSVTSGVAYQITAVGTTTAAQWLAKGVPAGVTAAVGVGFIASASGALGGTGSVKALATSGILSMELIGSPDLAYTSSVGTYNGEYLVFKFLDAAGALAAPAASSVAQLSLFFDASSVTIDGL